MSGLRYTGSDSSFLPWPSVSGSEWRKSGAGNNMSVFVRTNITKIDGFILDMRKSRIFIIRFGLFLLFWRLIYGADGLAKGATVEDDWSVMH